MPRQLRIEYPGAILSANNTQLSTSTYGIRHLFQGQLWTQETRLNDYRNRVAFPTMGVFLQPDPIGFKGDPLNLYRFCTNNAVNNTDPLGLYVDRVWQRQMLWQGGGDGTVSEQLERLRQQQEASAGGGSLSMAYFNGLGRLTNGPISLDNRAKAALDEAAVWAKEHQKEIAGTINSRGEIIVGPAEGRTLIRSKFGKITPDTVAIWHIHHMVKPDPYRFSKWPHGNDRSIVNAHKNLSHYVGVLNAPPGKFTIFAETPEKPFHHFIRGGPRPLPPPTIEYPQ